VDAPATLVWIAPEPPDGEQRRAIAGWAASRGVTLVGPAAWRPETLPVDPHIAGDLEDQLDRARDALAGTDGTAVDTELAKAEATLQAHPELPQAAWLMAELDRIRAVRLRQMAPIDPEGAARAWKRAAAIDGGRQAGMAERALVRPEHGPEHAQQEPSSVASVDIVGAVERGEQAWFDGRPVGRHVETSAGAHTAIVTWEGDPIWATWHDAPPGASSVALVLPTPPPCSTVDVARAHAFAPETHADETVVDAERVQCGSWVAALPDPGSSRSVRMALCSGDRCGPVSTWRLPEPWVAPPPPGPVPAVAPAAGKPWPAWVVWSAAGVGVAIAAGAAIALASSANPGPPQTRFVDNGIKAQ
jgi:hypothetical protein